MAPSCSRAAFFSSASFLAHFRFLFMLTHALTVLDLRRLALVLGFCSTSRSSAASATEAANTTAINHCKFFMTSPLLGEYSVYIDRPPGIIRRHPCKRIKAEKGHERQNMIGPDDLGPSETFMPRTPWFIYSLVRQSETAEDLLHDTCQTL
jgi:hypothetical protein